MNSWVDLLNYCSNMEDKSTEWVIMLLACVGEQVPILNTVILRDGRAVKYIYNDARGIVQQKPSKSVVALITSLVTTNVMSSSIMCCLIKDSKKSFIKKKDLKTVLNSKLQSLNQIQLCYNIHGLEQSPSYIISVYFCSNKYKSEFYSKTKNNKEVIKNTFTNYYAKEIASSIIKAIDLTEKKKVLKLEIEFLKDTYGKIYLHQVNQCKIISHSKLSDYNFASLVDLNSFITLFKRKKSKTLYESPLKVPEKVANISKISIESLENEENQGLKIDTRSNSRISLTSSRSSIDPHSQRASSIVFEPEVIKTPLRKSGKFIGTLKARMKSSNDDDVEDSWDYGNGNVQFLEMLSRQLIKENNFKRPISPATEELKQQIRMLNEKLSLSPSNKVFDYPAAGLPSIKISADSNSRTSFINLPKIPFQSSTPLAGSFKFVKNLSMAGMFKPPKKYKKLILSNKKYLKT
jgi:hypothetical protein